MLLTVSVVSLLLASHQGGSAPALNIPDGSTIIMTARVEGVQVFESVSDPTTSTTFNWLGKGPEATLYDGAHHRIGRLTTGPSFILDDATNISTDIHHLQSIPSPNPNSSGWASWPVSISSMLGAFTGVTTVLRVETLGGGPPPNLPTDKGQKAKTDFQATYIFLGTDMRNPNARFRSIMETSIGNVDWSNVTVSEALDSACFFPGISYYASPDLTARININARGMTFAQALRRIGEQAKAQVFLHEGKVFAVPRR